MKLKTFFEEFDQFADAPDAVIFSANGAIHTSLGHRLRKGISTPIRALKRAAQTRHAECRGDDAGTPAGVRDAAGLESLRDKDGRSRAIRSSDAGGIPACSRWLSPRMRATPPETRPPFFRAPAGVPAIAAP
jgi:hypothetical protein